MIREGCCRGRQSRPCNGFYFRHSQGRIFDLLVRMKRHGFLPAMLLQVVALVSSMTFLPVFVPHGGQGTILLGPHPRASLSLFRLRVSACTTLVSVIEPNLAALVQEGPRGFSLNGESVGKARRVLEQRRVPFSGLEWTRGLESTIGFFFCLCLSPVAPPASDPIVSRMPRVARGLDRPIRIPAP